MSHPLTDKRKHWQKAALYAMCRAVFSLSGLYVKSPMRSLAWNFSYAVAEGCDTVSYPLFSADLPLSKKASLACLTNRIASVILLERSLIIWMEQYTG